MASVNTGSLPKKKRISVAFIVGDFYNFVSCQKGKEYIELFLAERHMGQISLSTDTIVKQI